MSVYTLDLTHRQYLALQSISNGHSDAQSLLRKLDSLGLKLSRPAFYQLMRRMETEKIVKGVRNRTTSYLVSNSGKRLLVKRNKQLDAVRREDA